MKFIPIPDSFDKKNNYKYILKFHSLLINASRLNSPIQWALRHKAMHEKLHGIALSKQNGNRTISVLPVSPLEFVVESNQ